MTNTSTTPGRDEAAEPDDGPESRSADSSGDLLHISRWVDPLVERLGHDPRSTYVEQYWLGILGPRDVRTQSPVSPGSASMFDARAVLESPGIERL